MAFCQAVAVQFVAPAEAALLPRLVPRELLPSANGLNALNNNLARLIGPVLGGFAASLGIDRTVMTYLLDAFEGCGLVERQQDPADRRARRIVATDRGLEVLAAMDARVAAAEEELLSGLEPAQRAVLRTLLEQAASGTGPDHDPCRTVVQATRPAQPAPDAK